MRVVLLGNKDLAVRALDVLERHGFVLAGVVLNPDDDGNEQGRWYRSLRRAAQQRGLPMFDGRNVSSEAGRAFVMGCEPDLLLSISYARIVRRSILELPRRMAMNVHFSMLPHNRGCLPLVYAMASGARETGVSLHVMDEGIDTGPVLAQQPVAIEPHDTARSLYFKCVDVGEQLLDDALPRWRDGEIEPVAQRLAEGSYHPQEYPNDRWLQPTATAEELSCFVRSLTFPPYPTARVWVDGGEHAVCYRGEAFHVPSLDIGPASAEQVLAALRKRRWETVSPQNCVATN